MQDLTCNVFESFSSVFDQSPRTVESNLSPEGCETDVGSASVGMVSVNVLGKSAYGSEST
jgi:hypothetical protein